MAGHSHSANIAHRKGAQDAARGKIFQKLSKEIYVAATALGGPDPDTNPALKLAIAKAKAKNMPKDNIERALAKAKGDKNSSAFIETIFNATVSGGVNFIVVTLSDNINRVTSNVQAYFNKQNGSMGKTGQIPFSFDKKGIIELTKDKIDEDTLLMAVLEAGAENLEVSDETYVVTMLPENFSAVKAIIEDSLGINEFIQCEVTYLPNTYVQVDAEKQQKLLEFVAKLEDDDDIQEVYHNMELE
ncbi:YebC/PmpR family DNA-binding transcriptional regulator [Mycoplasmopsis pullorum]|uniref:YebC/PmpR family DNA-binding transcriptional regulator n=1 Tax=Mycoplasmopsis pullorum TaxID=48003 RepID=UPI001118FD19|nr:YebC/PmpR family DNA-binding transcriptional regulator [Mycoplasmopsis pullorum]TNK82214.1 YebC/PmpR family DNA-binding transcriptional regulator [Mycoplasmopsis pullorum]TNK83128.1 YebC/PmpR family DNA-binding transcriptional regulator [Mycoplasmopsis pullorum]TNK83746.1 YebC/PmpR family DNA-binding transcriptional regulator [Mycoplasmopsis pullorum]TNK84745.1 YebC/PmpR family DNA-binding transcriptional regulator [Mycoplasmopsis pullorum]TNK85406.1 YebC/PmpR family DNA-binding transcripti